MPDSKTLLILISLLTASFLGSWHCTAMCGPIASLAASKKQLWPYQLGRGLSYFFLGVLFGFTGKFFLKNEIFQIRIISTAVMGLTLIYLGSQNLWPDKFQEKFKNISFLKKSLFTKRILSYSGFTIGFLSFLLPCGWLYSFALTASATKSPTAGGIVMILFWLGGLPAMSILPQFVSKTLSQASLQKQKIAGILLVFAGLYSIVAQYIGH